jgi:hypothetical protein
MSSKGNHFVPFATLVAIAPNRIGIAVCRPKEMFKKKTGRDTAKERAVSGEEALIPEGRVVLPNGKRARIRDLIEEQKEILNKRAMKYFKNSAT